MDIAGLVRAARSETGLSQQALAKRAGIAPATLSRIESGAALPSLPMLDRVLATCGRDAQWRLVHRHADLDELLDRLAAVPVIDRLYGIGFRCGLLVSELAQHDVLVGGAWAAALHGIPHERGDGRLWVPGDPDTAAASIALLRRFMVALLENGRPVGAAYDAAMLERHPDSEWQLAGVAFRLTVLPTGDPWPAEQRLTARDQPLRVLAPQELGEQEGVRPDVLRRWLARQPGSAAGHGERAGGDEQDHEGELPR